MQFIAATEESVPTVSRLYRTLRVFETIKKESWGHCLTSQSLWGGWLCSPLVCRQSHVLPRIIRSYLPAAYTAHHSCSNPYFLSPISYRSSLHQHSLLIAITNYSRYWFHDKSSINNYLNSSPAPRAASSYLISHFRNYTLLHNAFRFRKHSSSAACRGTSYGICPDIHHVQPSNKQ